MSTERREVTDPRIKILQPEDVDPTTRNKCDFPYLDDFYVEGVSVHFEAMNDAQFWIGIHHPDGRYWHINCGAVNPNAKGYAHVEPEQ